MEHDPTSRAEDPRSRGLDDLADLIAASQRAADAAVDAGFDPQDLRGVGDDLYSVLRAQLQIANHLLRTGATLTERLVGGLHGRGGRATALVLEMEGLAGAWVDRAFRLRNHTARRGDVEAALTLSDEGGAPVALGRDDWGVVPPPLAFGPGEERTLVLRVRVPAARLDGAGGGPGATLFVGKLELGISGRTLADVGVVVRALGAGQPAPEGG